MSKSIKAYSKRLPIAWIAWHCLTLSVAAEPSRLSLQDQHHLTEYYTEQLNQAHTPENPFNEPRLVKNHQQLPNPINDIYHAKNLEALLSYLNIALGVAALSTLLTLLLLRANLKLKQENRLRQTAEAEIQKLAFLDTLTGLSNRHNFFSLANQALKLAHREERKFAVLFIDLNDFKQINDQFGHKAGDLVLAHLGHTLRNFIRDSDIAARLGGDEFALLLNNIHSKEDIILSLQKIQQIVCQPIAYMNQELVISASIGLAVFPDDALDIDGLLDAADIHMYQIKSEGKGSESAQTNFF